jgi:hypothetical protein
MLNGQGGAMQGSHRGAPFTSLELRDRLFQKMRAHIARVILHAPYASFEMVHAPSQ